MRQLIMWNLITLDGFFEGRNKWDLDSHEYVNSIQLVKMEGRWWIAHLLWDIETAANPIPDGYAGT